MVSTRRKLQVIASLAFLLLMAVAVGCNGFFVDPTLTGITVSTLQSTTLATVGSTVQMIASGTYDDGSNKNLSGTATWSVTPSGFIIVNQSGLATATTVTTPGTSVTVQAADLSSNGTVVTGSLSLTAGTSTILTITSSPASPISLSVNGTTVQFASSLNGSNVTGNTTFTSSNTSILTISGSTGTLLGTTGQVVVTGTNTSAGASGTLTLQINQ